MHIEPKDLQFIRVVIHAEVSKLAMRGVIRASDKDDFASELWVRLLTVWDRFDPTRGPREAYINAVVSSQAISILRERSAQKRRGATASIDAVAGHLTDPISTDKRTADLCDCRIDLEHVLQKLCPAHLEITDHLQRDKLTPVSAQMGIPRRTLRDACVNIRKTFRDEGLEVYR